MSSDDYMNQQRINNANMRQSLANQSLGVSAGQQNMLGNISHSILNPPVSNLPYPSTVGMFPSLQARVRVGFSNSREADVLIDTTDNAIRLAVPIGLSELATLQALHEQIAKQMAVATMEKDEADSRYAHAQDAMRQATAKSLVPSAAYIGAAIGGKITP